MLRDVEGLSGDEVCDVLDVSRAISGSCCIVAATRLREILETEMDEGLTNAVIATKDIVCQQAVELVTDYLEGALSRRDRRRFEAHLRACPNCTAYLEQIRMTIELTGAIEPDDLTPEAKADLTELYRRWRSE